MRRLLKGRAFALLVLLLISPILYLLHPSPRPAPISNPQTPEREHILRPIYEYTSLYRQHANEAFESFLEAKLRTLELLTTKSSSSAGLPGELVINQFAAPATTARYKKWSKQWQVKNEGWAYRIQTERPNELLALYSAIPAIAEEFDKHTQLQQDLVRYLTLWYHGGLYADIETWQRVSLLRCGPIKDVMGGNRDVSLMVGVGFDEPFLDAKELRSRGWTRGVGFAQVVMWAPKRFDPILKKAIVRSISHARLWKELGGDTSEVSGAGMFTDVVLEALSESLAEGHQLRDWDAGLERRVTWKKFKGIREPVWIEPNQLKEKTEGLRGLVVLPINVWGNGQSHSGSGTAVAEGACVNHMPGRTE